MDLVTLFQLVPPVLLTCIDHGYRFSTGFRNAYASLKVLRLVNKECSRAALAGLRFYTLTLKGPSKERNCLQDTNIGGARLLQHTRLDRLQVTLCPSGSYNPAELLQKFIREVDPSLHTVTSLELLYDDTDGGNWTKASMNEGMALLAAACPSLKSLSISANSPIEFLRNLGEACPLLTKLIITAQDRDFPYVQKVMLLQPTILPNISSLSLPGLQKALPDMSQNTGIVSLRISIFRPTERNDWLCLPQNLLHLKLPYMSGGQQDCKEVTDKLNSLISIAVTRINLSLHAVAQRIRAGVIPHKIVEPYHNIHTHVECLIDPSTAADLACLDQQIQKGGMNRFDIDVSLGLSPDHGCVQDFLLSLPCVKGVKFCTLTCQHGNLLPGLRVFPDLDNVTICDCDALTDLELHVLTTCTKLRQIHLQVCRNVTPMGMLAFCQHASQHLPELSLFSFEGCVLLRGNQVHVCMQLLAKYGSRVELYERGQDDVD